MPNFTAPGVPNDLATQLSMMMGGGGSLLTSGLQKAEPSVSHLMMRIPATLEELKQTMPRNPEEMWAMIRNHYLQGQIDATKAVSGKLGKLLPTTAEQGYSSELSKTPEEVRGLLSRPGGYKAVLPGEE